MPHLSPAAALPAGQVLSLRCHPGTVLRVIHGRLWVTQTHDGQDHFVRAGATLRLTGGHVVLEADDGAATYRLNAAATSNAQSPLIAASRRISWRTVSACIWR